MSDQNLDYAAIRGNIEKGVARQKWTYRLIFLLMHVLCFVVAMFAVWGTVAANSDVRAVLFDTGSAGAIIVVLPSILWAAVILFHLAALYIESSPAEQAMRQQLLMREVGEDILRKAGVDEDRLEKPKRSENARYVLSEDDGELLLVDDDESIDQSDHPVRAGRTGRS